MYLLSQLRKQGLFDECVAVVYDAIVLSKALYVLCAWGGYKAKILKIVLMPHSEKHVGGN